MKIPEPTMPPITSIVASNNPSCAASVGRGSVCDGSVRASRDGVESDKTEQALNDCRETARQVVRSYHRCRPRPILVRSIFAGGCGLSPNTLNRSLAADWESSKCCTIRQLWTSSHVSILPDAPSHYMGGLTVVLG